MTFWTNQFLGIRVFIWVFLAVSFLMLIGILLYYFREKIQEKYIKYRFPEKVIKVIIHFPGSQYYKEYWRMIPDKEDFSIGKNTYLFSDSAIIKQNDTYAYNSENSLKIRVDDREYNLSKNYRIKRKDKRWSEIHYTYAIPNPINFKDITGTEIKFTSRDLELFKENDLFQKLLTLTGEKNMLMFLMILVIGNLFATLFIIAKLMGWIK